MIYRHSFQLNISVALFDLHMHPKKDGGELKMATGGNMSPHNLEEISLLGSDMKCFTPIYLKFFLIPTSAIETYLITLGYSFFHHFSSDSFYMSFF